MNTYRYVIVGGGIAAGRAADGIRKLDAEGSIALVCAEAHPPYQRPPLSKGYLTGSEGLDHVYLKEATAYAQDTVDLITGVAATALDRTAHQVTLADGQVLGYERLLLATGGSMMVMLFMVGVGAVILGVISGRQGRRRRMPPQPDVPAPDEIAPPGISRLL